LAACVQLLIQTHPNDLLWIDIQSLLAAIGLFFDVFVQQCSIVRVWQVATVSHVVESRFDEWWGHYFFGLLSIMENLADRLDGVVIHLNGLLIKWLLWLFQDSQHLGGVFYRLKLSFLRLFLNE
jgi:hypothetical protein